MTDETSSATSTGDHLLRLAAVQLAYVPNIRKNQGSYWLPDEPLLAMPSNSETGSDVPALADLDLGEEFESRTDDALNDARLGRRRSTELKLKQILEFCVAHQMDVVVFPECSVPAELVHVLVGYRNHLVIFAGVGQLRESDAGTLGELGFSEATDAVECNAAVFVGQEELILVTKQDPAQGETIESGFGPQRVRITKGERTYVLGLAICMDYVNQRRDFDGGELPPQVVLVSALSNPTDDFLKVPRNFATVFSNHADHGGSAILAPHVAGLFVNERLGTEPLPPGEAIVSADFAGFPTRPRGTKPPQNHIHLRAGILYEDDGTDDSASAGGLARPMQNWSLTHYTAGRYTDFLATAERRLGKTARDTVLFSAVNTLRRRMKNQSMGPRDFTTATTHLVLAQVQSEPELLYAALNKLHEHWHPLLEDPSLDGLGSLIDKVNRARRRLDPGIRSKYQRVTPPTPPSSGDGNGHSEFTVFYSVRLGRYSEESAVRSLPRQLGVLRTLSLVNDDSVRLLYRVITVRQTSGNLAPFFDVFALTESNDPSVIEDLAEGVGQQLGVAFSGGWDMSSTPGQAHLEAPFLVELRPRDENVPLVEEDWGGLIDYLRALKPQVTVQMTLRRVPEIERGFTGLLPEGTGLFASEDRNAAAFFIRASQESADTANLALQVHVAADEQLGDSVLRSIGLWLFRGVPFEIVTDESAAAALAPGSVTSQPGTPLMPAEALRIFHPPYGRIEGRGLVNRHPRTISLPDITLPVDGINLGYARLAQAREDQRVVVRLDERARRRHTYIVGRTGSGKTNMLKHMARQDIQEGRSLVVIDPHGDLVDYLLGHTAGRENEVLFLDFGDPEYLPVLNPLDLDVSTKAELELAIEEFIQLLVRQSYHEFYGPRFEEIVRLALESVTHDDYPFKPPGVIDLVRVLRSKDRRRWIKDLLTDSDLKERWAIFELQQDHEIAEVLHWVLSKFSEMQQDGALGKVLAGGRSTVSIEQVVNNGGVLLVKLPEWELSKSAATLLGTFIQERVRKAVYARWRHHGGKSAPVYMYVDEFQAFAVTGFDELVAEARKFGLSLVLAHQNLSQLNAFSRFTGSVSDNLLSAILGNVANRIVFGVSNRDAKVLAEELDVPPEALRAPGNFQGVAQTLHSGETHTFTLQPPNADSDSGLPVDRDTVRNRMLREGHWRSRAELRADDEERESRSQAAVRKHLADVRRSSSMAKRSEGADRSGGSSFLDEWLAKRRAAENAIRESGSDGSARRRELSRVAAALRAPVLRAAGAQRRLHAREARTARGSSALGEDGEPAQLITVEGLIRDLALEKLSEDDRDSFCTAYWDALHMRVGTELTASLSEGELREFEGFMDMPDSEVRGQAWLRVHVPGYKGVVRRQEASLRDATRSALHRLRED
ncbi:type IV secretion system DNA-binding domain-containing protein [Streptomyces sp. AK04-3B]|uniref:type IV secretion system DNA-binding domain-containing protein n=1 Tax=Streptomyces sp. AK04-3B TaxID=3028650 RepID=UPI0029AF605E|nr:type IV secretion system DNA-binding domain-containing protein [Streptomyces sp. AK04-3B]MDX3798046.1 type IV secretion system DNA-binding domain-containing protein [Streptomyces sp. AK04-3B]